MNRTRTTGSFSQGIFAYDPLSGPAVNAEAIYVSPSHLAFVPPKETPQCSTGAHRRIGPWLSYNYDMVHNLNIGYRKRISHNPSDAVDAGILDGEHKTPDPRYLNDAEMRPHYLNGYQCGFRTRKAPPWPNRDQWMIDSSHAMNEARYPHYIEPPMA